MVNRGEIWLAQFNPEIGASHHTRLCVVVSPNEMHHYLNNVMVAPMSRRTQAAPFRVNVSFEHEIGLILLDQIHTLDKQWLIAKKGELDAIVLQNMLTVLQEIFAK